MAKKSRIQWHPIFQDILTDHLELLSGKALVSVKREETHNLYNDLVCEMDETAPDPLPDVAGIRPLDHLKRVNLFEYKSHHQSVTDAVFRDMVGRALQYEKLPPKPGRGDITVTLMTTRKPIKLLKRGGYHFEQLSPWKYKCEPMLDLEVYIIFIPGMRNIKGGDGMAMLQLLDYDKSVRLQNFSNILQQDLDFSDKLHQLMIRIDSEEVAMTYWKRALKEQFDEGKELGLVQGKELGKEIGFIQGQENGELSARLSVAKSLLKTKLTPVFVSQHVGLPLDMLLKLQDDKTR